MYKVNSKRAEEFIAHDEIVESLAYATAEEQNSTLMAEVIAKARVGKGLSHREVALLLSCKDRELQAEIYTLANEIKERLYGKRIVIFAPLYLSNYCVNGCVYCPYHLKNKVIPRRKLSQEEIVNEVVALQDMGHKRLVIETGEHPLLNPMEYILASIRTIYSVKHRNGAIRRINVNIAATTVENYRLLHEAKIGTYTLFQETYHKPSYESLHPTGPKSDYAYHTEAMDRAMEGGIDDVGLGVLLGLNRYKYDIVGMMMHAEHLEAVCGVGPHTISLPRICAAEGIDPSAYPDAIADDTFKLIVAIMRIALPYAGIIISTRESAKMRTQLLEVGITQLSGASRTTVGGYSEADEAAHTQQFDISDDRTLDEITSWLFDHHHLPSFCTACYRKARTGDRFMQLVKSGNIANCCAPNALFTLKEYLVDYASAETRAKGLALIQAEIEQITNEQVKQLTRQKLGDIDNGERDFAL